MVAEAVQVTNRATTGRGKNPTRTGNIDPQTGNLLPKIRPDIEEAFLSDRVKSVDNPDFEPMRIWTAGPNTPQEKIVIPGRPGGVRVQTNGFYLVKSQLEYDTLQKAIGKKKMWKDDLDEDEEDLVCGACQWHCRSNRAMNAHHNLAHAKPQAGSSR